MKRNILLLIIIVKVNILTYAQTPDYLWAKSAGDNANSTSHSITMDANGNSIVIGNFNALMGTSASMLIGSTTLINPYTDNTSDMFIAKYDASGNAIWAKSLGGNSWDNMVSVATDATGNIIVVGYFISSAIVFGSITLTCAGEEDIFIAKYDPSGNILWAKSVGSTKSDRATSVATDANDNIIVAGYFNSLSVTFDSNTLTNMSTTTSDDIFLAKYDASGNVLWAKSAGGSAFEKPTSVAIDDSSNILITGSFNSTNITFGGTTLANPGSANYYSEVFLVKYDALGNILWAKNAVGGTSDFASEVATDANGNIFIAGYFKSLNITFGSITLPNIGGNFDVFIAKYNTSGNIVWAKSYGGSDADYAYSLSTLGNGDIVMAGSFRSSTITFGSSTFTNSGVEDILLIKYDASGNIVWVKSDGGDGLDRANSIATDANNSIVMAGDFSSSSISFGSDTFIHSGWGGNMFVTKLNESTFIDEEDNKGKIYIYPNPNSGTFTIRSEIEGIWSIVNTFGQFVQTIKLSNSNGHTTSIEDLSKGVYFIIGVYNNKTTKQKIIVTK
jgi:hypothetical protein